MSRTGRPPGGERPTIVLAHPSPDLYGSDRMLIESVRALAGQCRVVVVLPADGPLCESLRAAGAEITVLAVPVLRKALLSPRGLIRLAAGARALLPAVRLLRRERAAVLYVSTITIPLWLVAARIARVPALCHVHEAEEGLPGPLRAALTLPLRLARLVVVNSAASAAALGRGRHGRDRGLRVIYNGVEAPMAMPPVRAKPDAPVRIVFVGRLSPRKGPDLAVEAVRRLRGEGYDIILTLVGAVFPGYEWYERELRAGSRDLQADGAVVFAGFRSPVWDCYAEADVAVVPSRAEPFGNVAVEAMLAGRPLVACATQGLTEIVTDGHNGVLASPDDPAALAAGIARLLDDWDNALVMAATARADAARRFGGDRYRDELSRAVRGLAPAAFAVRAVAPEESPAPPRG